MDDNIPASELVDTSLSMFWAEVIQIGWCY